jgi:hypothetical protein
MENEPKVLVLICATKRMDVLYKTISSMMEKLLWRSACDAIVNVDPIGRESDTPLKVIKLVELFIPVIFSREALQPHFGAAFYALWNMAADRYKEYDYVFHLEDDWQMLQDVDIRDMVKILEDDHEPDLALLRLPQFRSTKDSMKNWDKHFPWNGYRGYFECPDELRQEVGFCGHPSLIKMEYVKNCAPLIDSAINPEKQFHGDNPNLVEEVMKWRYGVFSQPNHPNYIQDLGREWMVKNKFRKAGSKAFFTEWEKVE